MKTSTHITIPFPRPTTHVFKGYKLNPEDRLKISNIRVTTADKDEIERVANAINMTYSEFVRWAAIETAKAVDSEIKLSEFR